ncbi:MAG: sigma-70 family RNA polymerase sigma factor [Candidatus Hydrogenedentes bacterium]|nr:sigma-70 family RNA polymerase sigma factor [Candidatus Hydrogenedentota bacterium]
MRWWTHSDAALVRATQGGDTTAFARLVERYIPAVRAMALSAGAGLDRADDVVQETFVTAWQKLDTLREPKLFAAWLLRIARNDALRTHRGPQNVGEPRENAAVLWPEPERRERIHLLGAALQRLPEPHREVLSLHYLAGYSLNDMAAMLNISRDAAAKRLERARKDLAGHILTDLNPDEQALLRSTGARKQQILAAVAALPLLHGRDAAAATGIAAILTAKSTILGAIPILAVVAGIVWWIQQAALERPAHDASVEAGDSRYANWQGASPVPAVSASPGMEFISVEAAEPDPAWQGRLTVHLAHIQGPTPIPDVYIHLYWLVDEQGQAPGLEAVGRVHASHPPAPTGADGVVTFSGLPWGLYEVYCSHHTDSVERGRPRGSREEDYSASHAQWILPDQAAPVATLRPTPWTEPTLARPTTGAGYVIVAGHVTDADTGAPITEFSSSWRSNDGVGFPLVPRERYLSSPEGFYALPWRSEGAVTITMSARPYLSRVITVTPDLGKTLNTLDLTLQRGVDLTVQIADAAGNAIEGAMFTPDMGSATSHAKREPRGPSSTAQALQTRTNQYGRVTLEGLHPDFERTFYAAHPEYPILPVRFTPGEYRDRELRVVLGDTATLSVSARNEFGPVAAKVNLYGPGLIQPYELGLQDGAVTFQNVPPGRVLVRVSENFHYQQRWVELPPLGHVEAPFQFDQGSGIVTGGKRFDVGAAEYIRAELCRMEGDFSEHYTVRILAEEQEDGTHELEDFYFQNLLPGTYQLLLQDWESSHMQSITLKGSEAITVVWPAPGQGTVECAVAWPDGLPDPGRVSYSMIPWAQPAATALDMRAFRAGLDLDQDLLWPPHHAWRMAPYYPAQADSQAGPERFAWPAGDYLIYAEESVYVDTWGKGRLVAAVPVHIAEGENAPVLIDFRTGLGGTR